MWQGESVFNSLVEVTTRALSDRQSYGGQHYYGDEATYYGTAFDGKLVREKFGIPGRGNDFQIKVAIETTSEFTISEITFGLSVAG